MSAPKFQAEQSVTTSQIKHVAPSDIFADHELNSRVDRVTPERIDRMKRSLIRDGQEQPIVCRVNADKRLQVVSGYTRHSAALLIEQEDPAFRLQVVIRDMNDRDAYRASIVENLERNDTTPIDDATNIRRLLTTWKYTRKEVAEMYDASTTWVANMLKLLNLPEALRARVSSREIPWSTALDMAKLGEAGIAETLKQSEIDEPAPVQPPAEAGPVDPDVAGLADAVATVKKVKVDRKAVQEAARKKGAKIARSARQLVDLLKQREDPMSKAIVGYLTNVHDEGALFEALDEAEQPVAKNAKIVHEMLPDGGTPGPVTSLRNGKKGK